MVNSKKMSKSSIAVIVLSILLVLSLILGFTGAWFTDNAAGNDNTEFNWGSIRVQYEKAAEGTGKWLSKDSTQEVDKVLPGDHYDLKGAIKFEGADSDMYMLVEITTPNAGDLKDYVKVTALTITGLNAYTEEGLTVDSKYQFFKVTAEQAASSYNVAGGVTIADETPNKVGKTQLNGGADKVTLSFSIKIGVIQARNISASDAYTALAAGVPAYNAQA